MEPNIAQPPSTTSVLPSSSLAFLLGKVTIGITTRNRWGELKETVEQLIRLGLEAVKVIVIDDGSTDAKAHDACKGLINCRILREEYALGLVVERNRLAVLCNTAYLISLDDDSCFVDIEGLEHAVRGCDADLSIAVVAFSVNTIDTHEEILACGCREAPHGPAGFLGCGYMVRVAAFRRLGGFRGYLYYMCEERDFALRVYSSDLRIVLDPDVCVYHRLAAGDRGSRVHAFYVARNVILIWFLNVPNLFLFRRLGRAIIGLVYLSLKTRGYFKWTVAGILVGIAEFALYAPDRAPMSVEDYKRWLTDCSGKFLGAGAEM